MSDVQSMPMTGPYQQLLHRLEDARIWDGTIAAATPVARRLVANEWVRRALHGDAVGVSVHAIMTDGPLGAWWGAQYLDLFDDPGSRRAATRLIALGVVSWTPTALAGLAEWSSADLVTRRVGVVHAALGGVAGVVYAGSWAARVRDHHGLGVALARLGGVVLLGTAFLGGHMGSARRSTDANRQAVGTSAARMAPSTPLT